MGSDHCGHDEIREVRNTHNQNGTATSLQGRGRHTLVSIPTSSARAVARGGRESGCQVPGFVCPVILNSQGAPRTGFNQRGFRTDSRGGGLQRRTAPFRRDATRYRGHSGIDCGVSALGPSRLIVRPGPIAYRSLRPEQLPPAAAGEPRESSSDARPGARTSCPLDHTGAVLARDESLK